MSFHNPRKSRKNCQTVAISLVAVVLFTLAAGAINTAYAQFGATGRIAGTVKDPSGAVVPGVAITATNVATNQAKTVRTNSEGGYLVPNLSPGRYNVAFELSGFERSVQEGVTVYVNRDISLDVTLKLGAVAETITVQADAETVEKVSGTLRATVENTRVQELPLNGRDVLQLMNLESGVIRTSLIGGNTTREPLIVVNGTRGNSNNAVLDGGTMINPFLSNISPFPNPDAIQEFTITLNSADAQYGRAAGATVTAVTKSGTNSLHGSVWDFLRNQSLASRPWGSGSAKSPFKRNQFGFSLGGPVVKDHTFFFASYQGVRERATPGLRLTRVPNQAERNGDLSQFFAPNSIVDPLTGTPFPNNQIPRDRLSPITQRILALIPLPNRANPVTNEPVYEVFPNLPVNDDEFVARIDHSFSSSDQLMGRFFWKRLSDERLASGIPELGTTRFFFEDFSQAISWTHTFGPKMFNEVTASYLRNRWAPGPGSIILNGPSWKDVGSNIPVNPDPIVPPVTPTSGVPFGLSQV